MTKQLRAALEAVNAFHQSLGDENAKVGFARQSDAPAKVSN